MDSSRRLSPEPMVVGDWGRPPTHASALSRCINPPRFRFVVGPFSQTCRVWTFLLALAAFIGTTLQMMLALVEARDAHREALTWARAEDDLVHEQPRLRRRSMRKELRSWRDQDTDRSLAYVDVVLFSWSLLVCASGGATASAVMKMF